MFGKTILPCCEHLITPHVCTKLWLLIADDVGVGKSIEAALVARELLDRSEVRHMAVLCPPQLAEQWQAELRDKFHIDAELVLHSTASRLERITRIGQSLFEVYPFTIVSTDFIKSDRRRADFLRTCPELVIVDEAHTCAYGGEGRGSRHQRHQLVAGLAANLNRHLILVTATPHSGNEEAFRSLLKLLDPRFAGLPEDLTGKENEHHRRQLAAHFVQRRRGDIRGYLDTITPFPEREESEQSYRLTEEYRRLFNRVLSYARETVGDRTGSKYHQRVRWWSALALLRSMASSPAAAAATLRSRAAWANTSSEEEANEVGRHALLDLLEDESQEGMDLAPGSLIGGDGENEQSSHRRLLEMAREADALVGGKDAKLQKAVEMVQALLKDGFKPIVFCRFIPTAEYVAAALREKLPRAVEVAAVTGTLPPAEREARVLQLGEAEQRVLVCTDCLSEGINLQDHFDAVLHYDLAWNPTRHEQREGRVDRYGQPSKKVRVVTYYGLDNQIDGIVLNVLIRKHQTIRDSLGISVPVPVDTEQVVEAIFEGLVLSERAGSVQQYLPMFDELMKEDLFKKWEASADREKRSRSMFAQETIKVDEVARELRDVQNAIGSSVDVADFTCYAFEEHGAAVSRNGVVHVDLAGVPRALKDAVGNKTMFTARFELPLRDGEVYLSRTHPIVEGLATYVMDTALDSLGEGVARRCGVIRTNLVETRTTLLLLRFRYHIITQQSQEGVGRALLAEDCQVVAFEGAPQSARWLGGDIAQHLLQFKPEANVPHDLAGAFIEKVLGDYEEHLRPYVNELAIRRGNEVLEAHRRVRTATRLRGVNQTIEAQLPPDVLGVYVYLPKAREQ